MSSIDKRELGMYHYYLVEAILDNAPGDSDVGDIFGYGEDCLVLDLFQYSESYHRLYDEAYQKGINISQTVVVFETPAFIAKWFWNEIQSQDAEVMQFQLPSLQLFIQMIKELIYK